MLLPRPLSFARDVDVTAFALCAYAPALPGLGLVLARVDAAAAAAVGHVHVGAALAAVAAAAGAAAPAAAAAALLLGVAWASVLGRPWGGELVELLAAATAAATLAARHAFGTAPVVWSLAGAGRLFRGAAPRWHGLPRGAAARGASRGSPLPTAATTPPLVPQVACVAPARASGRVSVGPRSRPRRHAAAICVALAWGQHGA